MILNTYPVELEPVDIAPYRQGNTCIDYVTTIDSGNPGPHVMVNAITHGNELCGVVALDFLYRHNVQPLRGKLTLGFANTAAYACFDSDDPNASRFVDEDLNRVWDKRRLDGNGDSWELQRAKEMRPLIDQVDFLLDLHSMLHDTPPLLLPGPLEKGRLLARDIGTPEHVVIDHGHSAGRRLRDYGAFSDPGRPQNALLIECGQHWSQRTAETAIEATLRFLLCFDLIDRDFATEHLNLRPLPQQTFIEVTTAIEIKTSEFKFKKDFKGMEIIPVAGTPIATDGEEDVLTPYDNCILIMPSKRLSPGLTAVRLGRQWMAD